MDISDVDKINILQNLLIERYNASHKMRDRSLKFTLWVFGYIVLLNGWLVINSATLSTDQKFAFTFLTIVVTVFTFFFIRDIKRGVYINRNVIIKIEDTLGLYDKGKYHTSEQILPNEYKNNQQSGKRGHFATIYAWIGFTCLLTIIVIWWGQVFMGVSKENGNSRLDQNKNEIQIFYK